MKGANRIEERVQRDQPADAEELFTLLAKAVITPATAAAVTGELVALAGEGRSPLVTYPGQPGGSAVAAGSVVDLHGAHVGQSVVLLFDGGDPHKPIVIGVLRDDTRCPLPEHVGQVDVSADGERLVVTAREQMVLRCGKASITLTSDGKVTIDGTYVCSRSSGVNRIKGGSVQLN
jgi:hypothetical protein